MPYIFTCVRNGDSRRQNCVGLHETGSPGGDTLLGTPGVRAPTFDWFSISGSFATTSQLSSRDLPELTPPWNVRPLRTRAFTLMSKPFQCSIWLPYLSDSVCRFLSCPNFW